MTYTPHGRHLIAGEWVASAQSFASEPASGPSHAFGVGTVELVDAAGVLVSGLRRGADGGVSCCVRS